MKPKSITAILTFIILITLFSCSGNDDKSAADITAQSANNAMSTGTGWINVGAPGFTLGQADSTSIAINSAGTPYIAFTDSAYSYKASVMKYNGSKWEYVGTPGFSKGSVYSIDLTLDSAGTPFVVFEDWANDFKATAMKFIGTSWTTLGSTPDLAYCPSIAVDSAGVVYIAFEDWSNSGKAGVMKYTGGAWPSTSTILSQGYGYGPKIAISSSRVPYIVFQDGKNDLKATVMRYSSGTWQSLGAPGFSAGAADSPDIAVSPATNLPYVVYSDSGESSKATVMAYISAKWQTVGKAGFSDSAVFSPGIAMNSTGTPYVVYKDYSKSRKATAMKFEAGAWSVCGFAGFSAGEVFSADMAVSQAGTPFVVYSDSVLFKKATVMKYMGGGGQPQNPDLDVALTEAVTNNEEAQDENIILSGYVSQMNDLKDDVIALIDSWEAGFETIEDNTEESDAIADNAEAFSKSTENYPSQTQKDINNLIMDHDFYNSIDDGNRFNNTENTGGSFSDTIGINTVGINAAGSKTVRISTGLNEESAADLEIPFGQENIVIKRRHSFNHKNDFSFGKGWFLNLDTRIILGVQSGAGELLYTCNAILANAQAKLADAQDKLSQIDAFITRVTALLNDSNSLLQFNINEIQNVYVPQIENLLVNANTAYTKCLLYADSAINYADYILSKTEDPNYVSAANNIKSQANSIKSSAAATFKDIYSACKDILAAASKYDPDDLNEVQDMINQIAANIVKINQARDEVDDIIDQLQAQVDTLNLMAAELQNIAAVASDHRNRNSEAIDPGYPDEQYFGNEYIKWIDEDGVNHIFRLNSDGSTTRIRKAGNCNEDVILKQNGDLTYTLRTYKGTVYDFGANGLLVSKTDRNNNTISIHEEIVTDSYLFNDDEITKIKYITDSYGRSLALHYNENHIVSVKDPLNRVISYEYESGILKSFADPLNNKIVYAYDNNLSITQITGKNGGEYSYEYETIDGFPRVVKVTDATGSQWKYGYDFGSRITECRDRKGFTYVFYSNESGSTTKIANPDGTTILMDYDDRENMISRQDEAGNTATFGHNGAGQVTEIHYPNGASASYSYDDLGQAAEYIDKAGYRTQYLRDGSGNLLEEKRPDGSSMKYEYSMGLCVKITDARDYVTIMEYDDYGYLKSEKNPLNGATEYQNDAAGRILTAVSPDGGVISYEYDAMNRILQITDPAGEITVFEYLPEGQVESRLEPGGRIFTFEYDDGNRLIRTIEPGGYTVENAYDKNDNRVSLTINGTLRYIYEYDSRNRLSAYEENSPEFKWEYKYTPTGKLTEVSDPLNNQTSYVYDNMEQVTGKTNAAGGTTCYSYDANGNLIQSIDPMGNRTSFTVDAMGRVVEKTGNPGFSEYYEYDPAGNLIRKTDPNGNVTQYGYNGMNLQAQIIDALGNTTGFVYDSKGRIIRRTDSNGAVTDFGYDPLDRIVSIKDALGNYENYAYDVQGNVIEYANRNGETWKYVYDIRNRLTSATDPMGNTSYGGYNMFDRKITDTDPLGGVAEYGYDALQRLVSAQSPGGSKDVFELDALGRRISRFDALNRKTAYGYDPLGCIICVKDPMGGETGYEYNANGNLISKTDPNGNVTRYEFDANGRITASIDAAGQSTTFAYDPAGNLLKRTWPDGTETAYSYDRVNRLVGRAYGDGKADTMSYDSMGNLVFMGNDSCEEEYQYDLLNRKVKTINSTLGMNMSFAYDNAGRRTSMTSPLNPNKNTVYKYDASGRMTFIRAPFDWKNSAEYVYDANNRMTEKRYGNGARTQYSYDPDGRPLSIETFSWFGTPMLSFKYEFDKAGNVLSRRINGFYKEQMAYDGNDRLTSYIHHGFSEDYYYDPAGNRIREESPFKSVDYSYNELNQLIMQGDSEYEYDARGNRIRETIGDNTVAYEYDIENRLTAAYMPDNTDFNYQYDASGRRVFREMIYEKQDHFHKHTFTEQNRILYDERQALLELDGSMHPLALHHFKPMEDLPYGEMIHTTYFKRHKNWSNHWRNKFFGWFGDPYKMKDPGWALLLDSEEFQPENHDDKWDGIDDKFSHDRSRFGDFFSGFDTDKGFYNDYPDETEISDDDGQKYADGRIGAGLWRQFRGWCVMHHYRRLVTQKAWYHQDMLGSTWKMTNSLGHTVKDYGYDAWGNLVWQSNGYPFGFWRHAWNPYTRSRFQTLSAHLYTGKEYDFGVDLYNYDARAYDSRSGQFMQADPYNLAAAQLPEEASRLAVCMKNPDVLIMQPYNYPDYAYAADNPMNDYSFGPDK